MNIELVGIPGVGKSYLCRSVEMQLLNEKAPGEILSLPLTTPALASPNEGRLENGVKKLARAIAFSCRHPKAAMGLQQLIFGDGQGFQRKRATKYVNLLSEMQRMNTRHSAFSLLTEQGVLQGIWSLEMLASGSICERLMQLTVPWLPDAIIVVQAERSQHEMQLTSRKLGQSNFDQLRGRQLSLAIERGENNLNRILALWSQLRPDGRRLIVNNEPERDAAFLYTWLSEQLR